MAVAAAALAVGALAFVALRRLKRATDPTTDDDLER